MRTFTIATIAFVASVSARELQGNTINALTEEERNGRLCDSNNPKDLANPDCVFPTGPLTAPTGDSTINALTEEERNGRLCDANGNCTGGLTDGGAINPVDIQDRPTHLCSDGTMGCHDDGSIDDAWNIFSDSANYQLSATFATASVIFVNSLL